MRVTWKQIHGELIKMGYVKEKYGNYYKGRYFMVRLVKLTPECSFNHGRVIQLAVKKNFDRWGNSVNFEIDVENISSEMLNVPLVFQHARKIVRAKIFNWNSYFHKIQLDCY